MTIRDVELNQLRTLLQARHMENRVRVVLHRFYAFFEAPWTDAAHHGELLTDDFTMVHAEETGDGTTKGRQAHIDSASRLSADQHHAHHLQHLSLTAQRRPDITGEVFHTYETRGPGGGGGALLRYELQLTDRPAPLLPQLSRLHVHVVETREAPFVDAHAENRVKAFIYRWCSLLERPAEDASALRELIAPSVRMHVDDGRVLTDFHEIGQWYTSLTSRVEISLHTTENLTIIPQTATGAWKVGLEFAWHGITESGHAAVARTQHEWILVDTGERYLCLKTFKARFLTSFTVLQPGEVLERLDSGHRPRSIGAAGHVTG
jgi:hypothetical protein